MVEKFTKWQEDVKSLGKNVQLNQCDLCTKKESCSKVRNARKLCDEIEFKYEIDFDDLDEKDNRIVGGLYGAFIGDALGVPYEFRSRNVLKLNPCETFIAFGSHGQPMGTWSDDSSLMLATIDAIIDRYSLNSIASRFVSWFTTGKFSPYGEVFDIGYTTREALTKYMRGYPPMQSGSRRTLSSGNGSLMRILPMAFMIRGKNEYIAYNIIDDVGSITHGSLDCLISCRFYCAFVKALMDGNLKEIAFELAKEYTKKYLRSIRDDTDNFDRIMSDDFCTLDADQIQSSGYVVHTLEAAVWCFLNTSNYKDCVLKAVNLGDDTDTVASVAGGLAGVYYGMDDIPREWVHILSRTEELNEVFREFCKKVK